MSVRRLAEDSVQPEGFKFGRALGVEAKGWIKKYPKGREQSAVIPLLMLAQEQEGWVTRASIEHIAEMLDMPLIRVMEVATFYTQFMLQPVGTKAHIQVCGTTPCMLRGSEELMAVCKSKINSEQFALNEEGTLSWEEVECQGTCVNAPMVMIFKDTYEDLTPQRLEEIIDAFEAGKGDKVKPGPQIDRIYSAPEGGLTTLNGKPVGKSTRKPSTKAARAKAAQGNSTMKLAATAKSVKPKAPAKAKVTGGKSTMKIAATAAGTAAKKSTGPVRLKKPTGKADDLKLISGVGPKLEKTLNGLGFWHFSQIAEWKKADITIVDDELSFKGRIERDDWVRQAKGLAKGDTKSAKKASVVATKAPVKKATGPERLKKPQGKADDLKLISGVGPKLEKTLNGLGFWHFSQIAKWKKADVTIVDDELSFKGRIERDDWIKQAKALAKGGEAEYIKVFGKKPR